MFFLNSNKADYSILIPTDIKEITKEVLLNLTKDIEVKPNYTLLCLVYKTSLFKLASNIKDVVSGDGIASVTPLIVKEGTTSDVLSDKLACKEVFRPIIAPSVIERGYEVFVPCGCSIQSILGYLQHDDNLRIQLFRKNYTENISLTKNEFSNDDIVKDNSKEVLLLSFKIVASLDITATIPINRDIIDFSFIEKNK